MLLPLLLAASTFSAPDWQAPTDHEHFVPRLSRRTRHVFSNLRYEGNNRALRTPEDKAQSRCGDAERTRALARRTAGLFLLRDALFSQQDHPVLRPACALMLPPNWVTVAVHAALAGTKPEPVQAPPVDDDAAWGSLATPADLFGGFPSSDSLHRWATQSIAEASPANAKKIANARAAVHTLAAAATELRTAIDRGPEATARRGGELIAASDRAYFGDTRHDFVIPLFVENPSEHEIVDEGKGLVVHGRSLDPRAVALTRTHVYQARLADGPMAIERYDITDPAAVTRAIEVLEELVPRGQTRGHHVYVWVGGPLIDGTERTEDVHDQMPKFVDAVRAANIEPSRVTVFARPVFQSKGRSREDLIAWIDRARDQGVLVGANMNSTAVRKKLGWSQ